MSDTAIAVEVVTAPQVGVDVQVAPPTFTVVSVLPTGPRGPVGATGADGPEGPAGPQGDPGPGVPTGGTAGQVLTKDSGTDFDTSWQDPTGGGGAVDSVIAGAGIAVDATDPANPVVTAEVTQVELDAEASARAAADTAMDGRLDAIEALGSLATDAELATEAATRAAADTALDARVDALEAVDPLTQTEGDARYWQLTTDLATQAELDTEASARAAADTALDGRLDALEAVDYATQAELDAHLNDTTDAHDASAISFTPTGTVAATDVQAAIAEVAAEAGGTTIDVPSTGIAATDTAALQAAHDALGAEGGIIRLDAGPYALTGGGLTFDRPVRLVGTLGPNGANQATGDSYLTTGTVITCASSSAAAITVDADGCTFENLSIANTAGSTPTSGSVGILINSLGKSTRIVDCDITGFYINLEFVHGYEWYVDRCHFFDPVYAGIKVRDVSVPDGGDGVIANSFIYAGPDNLTPTAGIQWESGGGLKVLGCKVNMRGTAKFTVGVNLACASGIATSIALITGNSIENVGYGVLVQHLGPTPASNTGTFQMVAVTGNQFVADTYAVAFSAGSTGKFKNMVASGNVGQGTTSFFYVENVDMVNLTGNTINSGTTALALGAGVTNLFIDGMSFTTAARPAATVMRAGSRYFDTTTGLPMWSTGSAWVTAVDLAGHLADTTAHDASAIPIADAGGYFTGTQVEAALQELGAAAGGTIAVEDEGVAVNNAATLNFTGAGVSVTDAGGGEATITISGGGGSVSDAAYDSSWNGDTTTAPSKNAVYDKIESMAIPGAWTSYTPTLTAATTDPVLGTGSTVLGRYVTIGRTVHVQVNIKFGSSGASAGSGQYRVSLPVTAVSPLRAGGAMPIGNGWVLDTWNLLYQVGVEQLSTTSVEFRSMTSGNNGVTHTFPFAWDNGDELAFCATYEAAA